MINLLIYILLVRLVFVADFLWDILFSCIFSQYFYCFLFLLCEAVYMKPDYPVDGTSLNLNYLLTYPVDGMFSKMYIYIQYTIIQKGREVCFFMGWLPYRFRAGLSATFQGLTLLGWAAIYKCQCCRLLVDLMCNVVSGHITDLRYPTHKNLGNYRQTSPSFGFYPNSGQGRCLVTSLCAKSVKIGTIVL